MNNKLVLKEKIKENNFKVGVIGLGYVGLPLAIEFADKDVYTIGFDLDESKVNNITRNKKSYIRHIPSDRIKEVVDRRKLTATSDFSKLRDVDVIIICVPTPLGKNHEPDMSFVKNTAQVISKYLRKDQLVYL
jgi:UDP-N-acetyl-D-glucosamine dehydrogenase